MKFSFPIFHRKIDPVDPVIVHAKAFEAVSEALKTSPTLENGVAVTYPEPETPWSEILPTLMGPGRVTITAADVSTTDYHLAAAAEMVAKLSGRKKQIESEDHAACLAYEKDRQEREAAHKSDRDRRRNELAELSRNIEFYSLAPGILKPPVGTIPSEPVRRKAGEHIQIDNASYLIVPNGTRGGNTKVVQFEGQSYRVRGPITPTPTE